MPIRPTLKVLAIVLCLAWAANSSFAYIVHQPDQGAAAIAAADVVVIGRLLATLPFDERAPLRENPLVVEQVFAGDIAVGDTLRLPWQAREWYPEPGVRAGSVEDYPRVGDYAGTRALWVLEFYHGGQFDSRYKYPAAPFVLSPDNRTEIQHLLVLLEGRLSAAGGGHRDEEKRGRIRAVAHSLRRFLEDCREH